MSSLCSGRRLVRAAMLLLATLALGLAAAGARSGADSGEVPPVRNVSAPLATTECQPVSEDEEPRTREFTLRIARPEGVRTAIVRIPARVAGKRSPLVVALHGGGASGRFMKGYSGLAAIGDRAGFVSVFPDATGPQKFWNLRAATGQDDVGFVAALIERVATVACIDPARVFAVGVSNGGGLAARVGCELSERVAGIVVVAGGFGRLPACEPERPVSVLEIHGSNDASVPYGGDPEDGRAGDVRRWLAGWAQRDGCVRAGPRRTIAQRTVRIDWRGCAPSAALAHIQVLGGGHQWPGATPPDPGPPSTISAAQQAWSFLARQRAPPRAG
jgi:polyhydroxybutyrate depolymerase